jgi:hypothetical protein
MLKLRPDYSGKIIESSWLIAIIVTPLFINIYSVRIFEEDKVNLIRTLATVLLPLLIIQLIKNKAKLSLRTPLVIPVLLTLISLLLSTVFSILPSISFFGEYFRRQGLYTHLTYLFFFLSIISLIRSKKQIDCMIDILIITTIPICLYGLIQYMGLDPFKWEWDIQNRIISTAGNAIFIAAYVIMVIPFTLIRLLQNKRQWINLLFYILLLSLQFSAIIVSRSRGPLLALLSGLVLFALCYGLYYRQKRILYTTVILFFFIVVIIAALNSQWSIMQPARNLPILARISHL